MSPDTMTKTPTSAPAPGRSGDRAPAGTNETVIAAIRAHHARLAADLDRGTEEVLSAVRAGDAVRERDALHEWYRTELLPHAVAEEQALYRPGEELATTRLLLHGMISEHRELERLIDALRFAADPVDVAAAAAAARAVFTVHLGKENDLLLPALDDAGLDLAAILEGMHEVLGHVAEPRNDDDAR